MYIKVSKGGGTCINLPKAFCEELDIKPGDELDCSIKDGKIILTTLVPCFSVIAKDDNTLILKSDTGHLKCLSQSEFAKIMVNREARIKFLKEI